MSENHTEYSIDYFHDPCTGAIVHDGAGKPLWTSRVAALQSDAISQEQHADYQDLPAWCRPETIRRRNPRSGNALLTGNVLLCKQCHLPVRKDNNGRLVAVIEQQDVVFVPEKYCGCEAEDKKC